MHIRIAHDKDVSLLADLYCQTVQIQGPQHYTPAQVEAWAAFATDTAAFREFILGPTTYVAEDITGLLGFAGIAPSGHVASAYVRHDCLHRGIGSSLMTVLLDYATQHSISRLYAEASEFSLGLFKKFGFHLYDTEVVERHGAQFTRYLVERRLSS